ncbi:mammalian ependymin-related protein 1-like [Elysia marginata]|uniref:Mammalian ependymin-related protein 1-like n=1 Tax=Elysia marginata TaxID=1093978 RepID=A0AAV4ELA3_9GAST|nr:mammalian ependymin-related protein 1-like [Elysia marginata]
MEWTHVAFVLCSMAALSWACCTPDQWQGVQSLFSGYAGFFHRGLITEFNDVAYDYEGKRSAVFLRYVNGDIEAKLKIVVRYEDDKDEGGMLYVDNYNKERCWKKRLEGEFHKACIPKDAKSYGNYSLGLKGKYEVTSYNIKGKRMDHIVTVQTLGEGVCAPIGQISMGRVGHYDVLRNVGFVDITPGIRNESVFDVPKDCADDWQDFDLPIDIDRQDYFLGV